MNVGLYSDRDEANISLLKKHPLPVVIYGAGELAFHIATLLRDNGVPDRDIAFEERPPLPCAGSDAKIAQDWRLWSSSSR